MRVLLDTNFLMLPFQNHLDVFEEIGKLLEANVHFIVLAGSLQELKSMKGKERLNARAMLQFVAMQSEKFEIINVQGKTDDLIMEYAKAHKEEGLYIATMDKFLRDKLRRNGCRVIGMKDKGRVAIL
ncbi:MAG: PIN domain-containing protein [Candidatus Micrarchaeota archaeon]